MNMRALGLPTLSLVAMPVPAFAQTGEIQIYDGETAPRGNIQSDDPHYGSTITASRFARPNAHDHKFFYAADFEFCVNHTYWEPRTITSTQPQCPPVAP